MNVIAALASNATLLVAAGTAITLVGTVVRVMPDLRRRRRRPFYRHFPPTRHLFDERSKYKHISGQKFETEDQQVIQEILDYIQELHTADTIERRPERIETTATQIWLYFDDSHSKDEADKVIETGKAVEWFMPEILTAAIETKCRNWGLGIAVAGGLLGVVGLLLA